MKLTHALASSSLLLVVSAIDQKRIKHNLRHLESAKNKNEDVERFLVVDEIDSMSMAAAAGDGGRTKSGKGVRSHRLSYLRSSRSHSFFFPDE